MYLRLLQTQHPCQTCLGTRLLIPLGSLQNTYRAATKCLTWRTTLMPFVNNKWSRNIFAQLIKTNTHRAGSLQGDWYSHSLCNSNEGTRRVTSFTTALTFLNYHQLACDYYWNSHLLWKELCLLKLEAFFLFKCTCTCTHQTEVSNIPY